MGFIPILDLSLIHIYGKSVRLSRDDMAELQTIASETLGMERIKADKRSCLPEDNQEGYGRANEMRL